MPSITWIGTSNFWTGRNGYKPVAIVDHIECGSEMGTEAWFKNPASKVSSHYSIAKDGTIHQYVKDEDSAWAVGIVNQPTSPLTKQYPGVNPNYYTISIEHEGQPSDGLTEAQYQSTLWLHKQLVATHGIPVDDTHITGHFAFDSVNRKDCPGPKFPWGRLFNDIPQKGDFMELRIGAKGPEVELLQRKLNEACATPKLDEDGSFGPLTDKAVRMFQFNHFGQSGEDGIVGPRTWDELNKVTAPPAVEIKPPVVAPKPAPEPQPAPAPEKHHVLEVDVDLDTGKVIGEKEVTE